MPHLLIEHSANVGELTAIDGLVNALHDAALETGIASVDALRTRAASREVYAIADRHPDNGFVAVTVRLGAGRSDADKHRLVDALMTALEATLGVAQRTLMLSVEYQEIDPAFRVNRNNLRSVVAERAQRAD